MNRAILLVLASTTCCPDEVEALPLGTFVVSLDSLPPEFEATAMTVTVTTETVTFEAITEEGPVVVVYDRTPLPPNPTGGGAIGAWLPPSPPNTRVRSDVASRWVR